MTDRRRPHVEEVTPHDDDFDYIEGTGWGLGITPEVYHRGDEIDRLSSGLLWLKCAVFALIVDLPLICLASVWTFLEAPAGIVFVGVWIVSVLLAATDGEPV